MLSQHFCYHFCIFCNCHMAFDQYFWLMEDLCFYVFFYHLIKQTNNAIENSLITVGNRAVSYTPLAPTYW